MKQLSIFLFAVLVFFLPIMAAAQTSARSAAVLPFSGETEELNSQFRNMVSAKIGDLPENFRPVLQNLPPGVTAVDFPPEKCPPPQITGNHPYAVTGYTFFDGWEYHLKMWLWDTAASSLVYADEMACDTLDQTEQYIFILTEWVFSHIPKPQQETKSEPAPQIAEAPPPVEPESTPPPPPAQVPASAPAPVMSAPPAPAPAPVPQDKGKWFWVGGRLGGSVRQYSITVDAISQVPYTYKQSPLSPTFEAALLGSFQILPFLALQGEAMFTMDFISFPAFNYQSGGTGSTIVESTATLRYMSLMFPLTLKLTLTPPPFLIAPFGGAYYILPLGNMEMTSPWEAGFPSESVSYSRDLPIGWLAGLTLGMSFKKLPGRFFVDIRYSSDLGEVSFDQTPGHVSSFIEPFKRDMLTVSIGYEIGLLNRK